MVDTTIASNNVIAIFGGLAGIKLAFVFILRTVLTPNSGFTDTFRYTGFRRSTVTVSTESSGDIQAGIVELALGTDLARRADAEMNVSIRLLFRIVQIRLV
uniref:Amino acid transporter n=1 Tax=Panagrellus redivivus TaxID=6233 RepID=A0A7E4VRW5_PANRE